MARLRGNDGMGLFTAGYDKGCLPVDPHQAARNNGLAWCPQARVADSALTKGTIRHERLQPQGGRGYCSPQQINSGIYHDPGKRNRGNGQIFERRIVPEARQHSTKALRLASEKLARLAEYMESHRK